MAVPSPSPTSANAGAKAELRRLALDRRRSFVRALQPAARGALEASLAQLVLPHLSEARVVAGYFPFRDEISPLPILDLLAPGQASVLPWFGGRDERMLFRRAPASEPSPWGMLQPPASAEALAPDVILVPLVLADRRGTRLGRGKGHYDRALASLRDSSPIAVIGIAWQEQISDEPIPADPWDVSLDAIATPAEWIICRHGPTGESLPESV